MNKRFVLVLSALSLLVGCTPATLVRPEMPEESQRAEVLVYRESAFNAGGAQMVFGVEGKDYVSLSNGEYVRLYLRNGNHNLFVRSTQADRPFVLQVSLNANDKKCLRAFANPANFGKALLPFSYHLSSTFSLQHVNCLSNEELGKYSAVPVEYEKK